MAGRQPHIMPTLCSRFVQTAMGPWSPNFLLVMFEGEVEEGNEHEGSVEVLRVIKDGRRNILQRMTNIPMENITSKLTFFCQAIFNLIRIGIGKSNMARSWNMLLPAAK